MDQLIRSLLHACGFTGADRRCAKDRREAVYRYRLSLLLVVTRKLKLNLAGPVKA